MFDKGFRSQDEYAALKSDFITEMRHLSKLRHPCITTVMGAVIWKREEPMLIMEYMDHGSLYDLLHTETMVLEGELVLPILRDVAQGVRCLHAATPKVIHGDLKAQNILVDSKFRAKVADFGLFQKQKVGATGTPLWMAPELLRGESENTAMSDVYSFGIILCEVYSRKVPYQGKNSPEVLRLVADPKVNKRPNVPESCPPEATLLMTDCLVADPHRGLTFEALDLRLKSFDVANVEPRMMIFVVAKAEFCKNGEKRGTSLLGLPSSHCRSVARSNADRTGVEGPGNDLFWDIVGCTDISSNLPAAKVSDMLNRLYVQFDELSTKHDIMFKIETIGDSYMTGTNLVKDQPDGVKRIAEFAVEACETAAKTTIDTENSSKGFVRMRVGFHTGPVVANVVGNNKTVANGRHINARTNSLLSSISGLVEPTGPIYADGVARQNQGQG